MQAIYWTCSLITLLLLIMSYKRQNLAYAKIAYVLITFRNILRSYNFENLKEGVFYIMKYMNMFFSYLLIENYMTNTRDTKGKLILGRSLILL